MIPEQVGTFQFKGRAVTILGENLKAGDPAPEFTVQDQDWAEFNGLAHTQGKVRIIMSLPSLSTSVCDRETRRFNESAVALGRDVVVMAVSNDLPYTQKNWCAAAGVDGVIMLSDHLNGDFGRKYAVLLKEVGVLRRAVFVVDRDGRLVYVAYMPALGDEPSYEEVLAAARAAAVRS